MNFLMSIKKNGDLKHNLRSKEKKKFNLKLKILFFEKGNFFHKNQSLPEIIFIEKINL